MGAPRGGRLRPPPAARTASSYVLLVEAFSCEKASVVSPIVATESLWGAALSPLLLGRSERVGPRLGPEALLVVAGGTPIGVYR